MSNIAVTNDNNNFAPTIFSHCVNSFVIVLDLGILYFGPKQSPPGSHNVLKNGAQLLLS